MRGGQGREQAEGAAGPGAGAFIGVHGLGALGIASQVQIGRFEPKSRVLVNFEGVLSKGYTRKRPWVAGRVLIAGSVSGKSCQEFTFTCDFRLLLTAVY